MSFRHTAHITKRRPNADDNTAQYPILHRVVTVQCCQIHRISQTKLNNIEQYPLSSACLAAVISNTGHVCVNVTMVRIQVIIVAVQEQKIVASLTLGS
jgi:hypothetical protein